MNAPVDEGMSVHHTPPTTPIPQSHTPVQHAQIREIATSSQIGTNLQTNTSRLSEQSYIEMANPAYHGVSIKYALEAVPIFDGNNIPLNHFLEGCEEARDMLPLETEDILTRVIRNKLRGEARRAIHGMKFETITDLSKF